MKMYSVLFLLMILLFSCATAPEEKDEPQPEPAPVEEPAPETPEPEPEAAVEEPLPEEEVVINDETGFAVSQELYNQTLDEIKELIQKLNTIISDKNYEKWKLYLSDKYIQTYNDKSKLKMISENSQILSDNNIVLSNLKDYFEWVVVPSRSKASVDDIVFEDETHIKAYMLIKEKPTILYQLENIDGKWRISVW